MNDSHRALVGSSESVSLSDFDYLKSSSSLIHKVCDWPGELVDKIRDSSDFTRYFILFLLTSALLAYGSVASLMLITNPPAFYIMFAVLIVTVAAMTNAPFVREVAKALLLLANAAFYYAIIKLPLLLVKFSIDLLMSLSARMQQNVLPFLREQLTMIGKQAVQLLSDAYEGLKQNVVSLYQLSSELVNRATNAINSTERLVNLFASIAATYLASAYNKLSTVVVDLAKYAWPFSSNMMIEMSEIIFLPAKEERKDQGPSFSSTGTIFKDFCKGAWNWLGGLVDRAEKTEDDEMSPLISTSVNPDPEKQKAAVTNNQSPHTNMPLPSISGAGESELKNSESDARRSIFLS